jgi:hypothetical protein
MAGNAHNIEQTLRNYSKDYNLDTFVETGTFNGVTTEIASKIFKHVYSIELSEKLYCAAQEKFKSYTNVTCMQGDSPDVLVGLIENISEDALFFLDAHWAGDLSVRGTSDSPLLRELSILAKRNYTNNDLIIVDDVSFFNQKGQKQFGVGSSYFPQGGVFEWDWSDINISSVVSFFPEKTFEEKDDRLFVGIRSD